MASLSKLSAPATAFPILAFSFSYLTLPCLTLPASLLLLRRRPLSPPSFLTGAPSSSYSSYSSSSFLLFSLPSTLNWGYRHL